MGKKILIKRALSDYFRISFLLVCTRLYSSLRRSVGPLSLCFFLTFGHYCSWTIARDCSVVYPALLSRVSGIARQQRPILSPRNPLKRRRTACSIGIAWSWNWRVWLSIRCFNLTTSTISRARTPPLSPLTPCPNHPSKKWWLQAKVKS